MGESAISFVTNSGVRSEVLLEIAGGRRTTDAVLQRVDASESAVYNALSALERRVLVTRDGDDWLATGKGQLVGSALDAQRRLESALESEYWANHDVSPIPPRLRVRLGELSSFDVVRASDADPYGVVREVTRHIESADDIDVVSPIYQPDYVETMPDSGDARLVVNPSVLETALESDEDAAVREFENTQARFLDVNLALSVTESNTLLSLPTLDGQYDARSTVIAESTTGVEWGTDLFEHLWERATPAEEVLAEYDL